VYGRLYLSTFPKCSGTPENTPEKEASCQAGENNRFGEPATRIRRKTEELFNEIAYVTSSTISFPWRRRIRGIEMFET
jgi:hypothetical protein